MAKQKLPAATKNITDYNKYLTAFKYFNKVVDLKKEYNIPMPKDLTRPTKVSVKNIKKLWGKLRKTLQEDEWEVPTITQINQYYEINETPPPREEADPAQDFVEEFRQNIRNNYEDWLERLSAISDSKVKHFRETTEASFEEAMFMLDAIIDAAGGDYDIVADAIKNQPDYLVIQDVYIQDSDGEEYVNTCVEFFTAVMVDVKSRLAI